MGSENFDPTTDIKATLSRQLNSIFDDLTGMYNRVDRSDKLDKYDVDFDLPVLEAIEIIHSYWDIKPNLIISDFKAEEERQKKLDIEIPNVPTYQIRFALEEGSWVILLRDYYRSLIKNEFTRILTLEELIWETGAGTNEDLAYYLIEMSNIGQKFVKPIYKLWKSDHDYAVLGDFGPVVIAAVHQVPVSRGRMLFKGAQRLLNSKFDKLTDVRALDDTSHWVRNSIELLNLLEKNIDNPTENIETGIFLITLSLIQKEVIKRKQRKIEETFEEEPNYSEKIHWDTLDPESDEDRTRVKQRLLNILYQRPETKPREAGKAVLEQLIEDIDLPSNEKKNVLMRYDQELQKITDMNVDSEAEAVQQLIPSLITKLKEKESNWSQDKSNVESLKEMAIWDAFVENIQRVNRLDNHKMAQNIIIKALKSAHQELLKQRIGVEKVYSILIDDLLRICDGSQEEITNLQDKIMDMVNEYQENNVSWSEIDEKVMTKIADFILENYYSSNS